MLAKRLDKGPLPLEQVLKYGARIAEGRWTRRTARASYIAT
jgi:hypothetical protein